MMDEINKESDSNDENDNMFSLDFLGIFAPNNFKMPMMDPYDGTVDPRVHLMRYVQHMGMEHVIEDVMRRCFLIFITGLATMSICKLDHGSIGSGLN